MMYLYGILNWNSVFSRCSYAALYRSVVLWVSRSNGLVFRHLVLLCAVGGDCGF